MKKIFIIALFLLIFTPIVSFSAVLSLDTEKQVFTVDEEFLVEVFIDTEDVSVNAVEGVVRFPLGLLTLKEIRDGNSSINFWVEKPASQKAGEVYFSGITTGGFSGANRFLFGMVLQANKIGSGSISWNGVQILQNDGLGTKVKTQSKLLDFTVSGEKSGEQANLSIVDTNPPEIFSPFIGSDPSIFNGQYFVVFSTVDKGVGIDHYEVREGIWGNYVRAESPYLLTDQALSKKVSVTAFDKSGNTRTIDIKAKNPSLRFQFGVIIGIILIICIFFWKKIRSIFSRR